MSWAMRGGPQTTHQLPVGEKPRLRRVHACGVDDMFRHNTSKEPLEKI